MVQNLYKCLAMYQREALIRFLYAYSEKQARARLINRLAEEQGIDPHIVFWYFRDHPDAIKIQIEMEVTENEDVGNK